MITVRFAPSPTGRLHVGNIRTALINALFAIKSKGTFVLRMDDTDLARSKQEYADQIMQDLEWLNIHHQKFYRQSDRMDRYDLAIEQLKAAGCLYPCYETAEELAFKRKRQLGQGKPPIYDRAALDLTEEQKQAFEAQGIKPHWRLKLTDKNIEWNDLVRGLVHFEGAKLSDPVLLREDGMPVYTLASVVDDLELGITHVIRGEDHVANTAVQIQLIEALGGNPEQFKFAHLQLLQGAQGEEFSKRLGTMSIASLREQGIEAMALNSYLATMGTSEDIHPFPTMEALAGQLEWSKFGRSSPKFDVKILEGLSATYFHTMDYKVVCERFKGLGITPPSEALWLAVRTNIQSLNEISNWEIIIEGEIEPVISEVGYIEQAIAELLPAPWNEDTWKLWTDALKAATGRKGKDLFKPLRLALTGFEHGPEMKLLLPLMGYERVHKRLVKATKA